MDMKNRSELKFIQWIRNHKALIWSLMDDPVKLKMVRKICLK